jgi:surface polysaccharide O-acyltransferase-like enzyme
MSTRSLVSPEISKRFDVLRTLLVVFVIGIHAEKGLQAYYPEIPELLQAYLVIFPHNIFRLCVPIFFTISGYLFFLTYKPTSAAYGRMVLKKTRTILLPYVLFNAITIGLILLFNKVPYMGDINMIRQDGYIKLLFGLYRFPAVYTLWFLRDLYVYFLLAPVFFVVSAEIPRVGVLVFWALWNFVPQAGFPVELSGAFFFYLGCMLCRTGANLDGARSWLVPVLCLYAALLLSVAHVEFYQGFPGIYYLLYRSSMIAGTAAVWLLSAYPFLGRSQLLLRLSAWSFFVYLTHEPVLSYLIYATRYLGKPAGTGVGIAYMWLLIGLTFALCYLLARLLERYVPRLYALATGSR